MIWSAKPLPVHPFSIEIQPATPLRYRVASAGSAELGSVADVLEPLFGISWGSHKGRNLVQAEHSPIACSSQPLKFT